MNSQPVIELLARRARVAFAVKSFTYPTSADAPLLKEYAKLTRKINKLTGKANKPDYTPRPVPDLTPAQPLHLLPQERYEYWNTYIRNRQARTHLKLWIKYWPITKGARKYD